MTGIAVSKRQLVPPGVREEFVTVWGHRMRYLTAGAGPPLVLLPGIFGFSFSWSENLAALAQCATVYAPDLLNTGYSDRAEVDTSLCGIAEQVFRFMDAVGIRKTDILGSSHGGSVAMALAAKMRQRVARLILVSPSNPWSENMRFGVSIFGTSLGRASAPSLRFIAHSAVSVFLKRMYHDSSRIPPGSMEGYAAPLQDPVTLLYLADVASSWYRDFVDLKSAMLLLADLSALLLWGTHDPVVPLETAQIMLRHLPNARLVTLETGHLPYEELPDEFNRVVLDFLVRQE